MVLVNTFAGVLDVVEHDTWIRNHSIGGHVYEEHIILGTLKPFIEKSKYILDVGANNGNHTISYAFLSPPDAKIYAFEPQKRLFTSLQNAIKINKYDDKVTLYNNAVGHELKKVHMNHIDTQKISDGQYNLGGLSIGEGGEEAEMITIDSLNLDGCDFIKIDVEGYEYFVLEGAVNTIKKYNPFIMFEHNGLNMAKGTDAFKFLSETCGYRSFHSLDWCNWITFK